MSTEPCNYYPIIITLCLVEFMATVDSSIVLIALPTIAEYFNATTSEAAAVELSYLLFLSSVLLIFGKVTDKIGPRRAFILGQIMFLVGSLFCSIAPNLLLLIVARCIQGIGGAMLMVTVYAIVIQFVPLVIRGRTLSMLLVASALGFMLGAPIGGLLTGYLSWRWLFFINIPLGLFILVFTQRAFPSADDPPLSRLFRESFNFWNAIFCFISVGLLFYGLGAGHELGWQSIPILGSLLISLLSAVILIYREVYCPDPFLDIALMKNRYFLFGLLAFFIVVIVQNGSSFLLPFYLELVKKLEPQHNGLLMIIVSGCYAVLSPLAGKITDQWSPRGLSIIAAGLLGIACLVFASTLAIDGLFWIVVALAWFGASFSLFQVPAEYLLMSFSHEGNQGNISGMFNFILILGAGIGISLTETVFSGYLPTTGHGALAKAGLPVEVLATGFQKMFILAAVASFIGMGLCFLARINPQPVTEKIVK
ncbi:MAG: MFS transporter [Candidatus Contendobacter sp.]|jgi:EmrB/QacA subfamily drug resistance transporter|nr:MFS transporter [Gammaproteobacteria bacterium]MCC8992929.1 MFS transporter [Candidatus Contendobacter sp.]